MGICSSTPAKNSPGGLIRQYTTSGSSEMDELTVTKQELKIMKKPVAGALKPQRNMSKVKILTDSDVHRMVADTNLKAALGHPIVISYFREYMKIQNNEDILNYYLDAVDLRNSYANKLLDPSSKFA